MFPRRTLSPRLIALIPFLLAAPSALAGPDQLTVNGEVIPAAAVDYMVDNRMERSPNQDRAKVEEQMRQELIARTVLAQEARKEGIDQRPDVKAQDLINHLAVVSQAYLEQYRKDVKLSDDDLKAAYEEFKKQNQGEEAKVRHIVTEKEEDALKVVAALNRGEDFETLAKEHSIEPGVDKSGGELGWMRPDQFPDRTFAEAVNDVEKGKFTQNPIKTEYGWHVVMVEDRRPIEFPPFDEIPDGFKPHLREMATQKKINERILDLINQAKVEEPKPKAKEPKG